MSGKSCLFAALIVSFLSLASLPAAGETRYSRASDIELSGKSVISMITVLPGEEVYSLFGHSAFRVYDPEHGIDWMFNYGTFDFSDPLFVPRFISGQLDYYLDVTGFQASLRFYSSVENRTVIEQVLDLEHEERIKLFDFLMKNAKPENRFYRYDFIKDNCSTRIADALDLSLGRNFTDYSSYSVPDKSFRQLIRKHLRERPYTDFGIQLLLGSGADRKPEKREVFFLPLPLMDAFDAARRTGPEEHSRVQVTDEPPFSSENAGQQPSAGSLRPLVNETRIVYQSDRRPYTAFNWPFIHFMLLLLIYTGILRFNRYILSRKKRRRRLHLFRQSAVLIKALCETVFLLFTGTAGLLIFYLWFISDHTVTKMNYNLLWCSPLSLLLFVLYASGRLRRTAVFLSGLVFVKAAAFIAVSAAGVQAAHPAAYPLVLALMLTVFGRFYSPASGKLNIKGYWKRIS